jgi:hypothetical protein
MNASHLLLLSVSHVMRWQRALRRLEAPGSIVGPSTFTVRTANGFVIAWTTDRCRNSTCESV